ncbi:MAG: hypothetical protein PVJ39_03790 [Gammaproteobacteria bacterium]
MNIVLNPTSTAKQSKSQLQARFDKLRQQLLKQQKLNQKFQEDLDELVTIYQTELAQMDSKQVEPLTRLTEKLIDFMGRKSLSNWHREELGDWIIETISRIGRVDPETADKLHRRVRQLVASQMGMTEEEMDEEAQQFAESMKEAFESVGETESSGAGADFDDDDPQEDMFGFDDVFEDWDVDDDFAENNDPFGGKAPDTDERRRRLMDGSWARTLFRRAAQALHPDREQDPEQRQAKERSMQQLLEARNQGDILTLLHLYSEGAGVDDLVLAEQEMKSACQLMEEQLNDLRNEQSDFIYDHPLRMLVHDLFYSSSRKTREKNIHLWKQDLKAEAQLTSELVGELRNLKVLKEILEERREERYFRDFEEMFDGLWK